MPYTPVARLDLRMNSYAAKNPKIPTTGLVLKKRVIARTTTMICPVRLSAYSANARGTDGVNTIYNISRTKITISCCFS